MSPVPEIVLRMDDNNRAILVQILERHEDRVKAIAKMIHTTEAERAILLNEAAVAQQAYLQLEGIDHRPAMGQPDWSDGPTLPVDNPGPSDPESWVLCPVAGCDVTICGDPGCDCGGHFH